ncbi:Putative molting cycle collagen and cuticulin-based cuticle [Caligus rogercresseyi]|uniref:Molting cycle collagen and cuticulin-based cuticle n=1 Tax=Caligus rogercresseyi TaxID=217165 RepID=A0A7T8GP39_CALRO|nr:Putative molting cycle collagen and cuticulin-based cuticle [Caligus rogercresseyi]
MNGPGEKGYMGPKGVIYILRANAQDLVQVVGHHAAIMNDLKYRNGDEKLTYALKELLPLIQDVKKENLSFRRGETEKAPRSLSTQAATLQGETHHALTQSSSRALS